MVSIIAFEPSEVKFVQGTVSRSSRDCEFKDENRAAEYNQEQPSPCKQCMLFFLIVRLPTPYIYYVHFFIHTAYVKQQSTNTGLFIGLPVSMFLLIVVITCVGVAKYKHHRAANNHNRRDYIAIDNHNRHNQGAPDNLLHNNLAPVGV